MFRTHILDTHMVFLCNQQYYFYSLLSEFYKIFSLYSHTLSTQFNCTYNIVTLYGETHDFMPVNMVLMHLTVPNYCKYEGYPEIRSLFHTVYMY